MNRIATAGTLSQELQAIDRAALDMQSKLCAIFAGLHRQQIQQHRSVSAATPSLHAFRGWRRPLSGVLMLVACGWLLAFATHFHVSAEEQPSQAESAHVCEMCAALAVGVPVAAPVVTFFTGRPIAPAIAQPALVRSVALCASYQSRAPPSA